MSYQILWQNKGKFTSSHWRTGVWIIRTIRYGMVTLWLSIVLWHSQNPCRDVALVIPYYWDVCWLKRLLNSIGGMGLKRNGNSVWMNVVTERAEHRMFHIMLDKFGSFTMTIGGYITKCIVYTMVSIDMCKHKAGYRLYHKTNAIADLESWGLCPFTMIISIRLY